MNTLKKQHANRRSFLKGMGSSAVTAAVPWTLSLAAMGEASAATASDYKALVCIFLHGGCDYANTLVTYDTASYNKYANIRGTALSIARNALDATVLTPKTGHALPDARQYALAPTMAALLPLFNDEVLAPVLNVGTLVRPTTKADYDKGFALPPKLMSHVDQQTYWQSSRPTNSAFNGWGGRLADWSVPSFGSSPFTCVNLAGNAPFVAGTTVNPYQMNPTGLVGINELNSANGVGGSVACTNALRSLLTTSRTHLLEAEYVRLASKTINTYNTLSTYLVGEGEFTSFPSKIPSDNVLADQLKMVARMIATAQRNPSLNLKRQVFFVELPGFDLHDGLMNSSSNHAVLVKKLALAMVAFYNATKALGLQNNVTTFTASEFGRSLRCNTDGSDHGWGGHHFVMGGAVKGKRFYGKAPQVGHNTSDDIGQGRLLPSTSVDQYAATMGKWFGASPSDLDGILPNLRNWTEKDLGFL